MQEEDAQPVRKPGRPPLPYFKTVSGNIKKSFGKATTILSTFAGTSMNNSTQGNRGITAYLETYHLVDPKNQKYQRPEKMKIPTIKVVDGGAIKMVYNQDNQPLSCSNSGKKEYNRWGS